MQENRPSQRNLRDFYDEEEDRSLRRRRSKRDLFPTTLTMTILAGRIIVTIGCLQGKACLMNIVMKSRAQRDQCLEIDQKNEKCETECQDLSSKVWSHTSSRMMKHRNFPNSRWTFRNRYNVTWRERKFDFMFKRNGENSLVLIVFPWDKN
jgi:hypothetical protein